MIFEILVPKAEFSKLNLVEEIVVWGDEKLSKSPPEYRFCVSVIFFRDLCTIYHKNVVGDALNIDKYTVLTLKGEGLSDLERSVSKGNLDKFRSKNEIISFLWKLCDCVDEFIVIMIQDGDEIDKIYQETAADKVIDIILDNLNWNYPKRELVISKLPSK